MTHWTDLGLRHVHAMSARTRAFEVPERLQALLDARHALLEHPLTGIHAGEQVRSGLYPLQATAVSTAPILEAAHTFLESLNTEQRRRVRFPMDSDAWRTWLNLHGNVFRHGLMLEDLSPGARELALALLRTTLSERGFRQARDIMRINGFLAEYTGRPDDFGEWPYFISIFGDPSPDAPWGWQIDGHHLSLNCVLVGDQLVLAPAFMGSEPCELTSGPLAGISTLAEEAKAGLAMIRSLDSALAAKATLRPSILPGDLPEELQHPFDGRMVGGAFQDNARVDYAGVCASELSDEQRRLLMTLIGVYVEWTCDRHAAVKMREVTQHLEETWFSWMGAVADEGPYYYRVHSPVVLIEYDHRPGVVFDNDVPSPHHVHTIVRAPNGGDYAVDLIMQHHERHDHAHGDHRLRR